MTTRTHARIANTPADTAISDAVLQSQIEDCEGVIRDWIDALGGPCDVILWRAPGGAWWDFRRRGVWWVRVR